MEYMGNEEYEFNLSVVKSRSFKISEFLVNLIIDNLITINVQQ